MPSYKCTFVSVKGVGRLITTVKASNESKAAEKALKSAGDTYALIFMEEVDG